MRRESNPAHAAHDRAAGPRRRLAAEQARRRDDADDQGREQLECALQEGRGRFVREVRWSVCVKCGDSDDGEI